MTSSGTLNNGWGCQASRAHVEPISENVPSKSKSKSICLNENDYVGRVELIYKCMEPTYHIQSNRHPLWNLIAHTTYLYDISNRSD